MRVFLWQFQHKITKEYVQKVFERIGFRTCPETMMADYHDMRTGIIDFLRHGCKYRESEMASCGPYADRIDVTGVLCPDHGGRDPALLMAVEIAYTSLDKDIGKLKGRDYFDGRIIITKAFEGEVSGCKIVSLDNFTTMLLDIIEKRLQEI